MSIGNLKDTGNQGNNYPYQMKTLLGLQQIVDGISSIAPPGGAATETTLLIFEAFVEIIKKNSISKIGRIQGASNYNIVLAYNGDNDITSVTHTGTTEYGVETIIETFTYDVNGNVTQIQYS
jgi:hypothetical protein